MVYDKLMDLASANKAVLESRKYTWAVRESYTKSNAASSAPATAEKSFPFAKSHSSAGPSGKIAQSPSISTTESTSSSSAWGSLRRQKSSLSATSVIEISDEELNRQSAQSVKGASAERRTPRQRPQNIRAYNLWHDTKLPVSEICGRLRSSENPLKLGTVM